MRSQLKIIFRGIYSRASTVAAVLANTFFTSDGFEFRTSDDETFIVQEP